MVHGQAFRIEVSGYWGGARTGAAQAAPPCKAVMGEAAARPTNALTLA
ncbi:hypothetical protein CPter91_3734 [Collimonas pratensis]|uniref:Uncharacterized protein n=1 Tax=Collimonas pratensis TaxID=279113 RepID=A0A127Q878_9BURK|nr:hypothetical protein CPter91_3734 [Collimonas pratensis]